MLTLIARPAYPVAGEHQANESQSVAKGLAVPILHRNRSLCLLDVVKGMVRQSYLRVSEVFLNTFSTEKVFATAA